jgi:hypothetical protein
MSTSELTGAQVNMALDRIRKKLAAKNIKGEICILVLCNSGSFTTTDFF